MDNKTLYDPDVYKRKLTKLFSKEKVNIKVNDESKFKFSTNDEIDIDDESQPSCSKEQKHRTATPHPKKIKPKLTARNLEKHVQFSHDDESDSNDFLKDCKKIKIASSKKFDKVKKHGQNKKKTVKYLKKHVQCDDDRDCNNFLKDCKEKKAVSAKKLNKVDSEESVNNSSQESIDNECLDNYEEIQISPIEKHKIIKKSVKFLDVHTADTESTDDEVAAAELLPNNEKNKKRLFKFLEDSTDIDEVSNSNKEIEGDSSREVNKAMKDKRCQRQATPYNSNYNKKLKLKRNLEDEYDNSFDIKLVESIHVSTSEIPKKKSLNNIRNENKSGNNAFNSIGAIICESTENLPDINNSLIESDESLDECDELNITSDCSGAVVCSDIGIIEEVKKDINSVQNDEDLLDISKLIHKEIMSHSGSENCFSGSSISESDIENLNEDGDEENSYFDEIENKLLNVQGGIGEYEYLSLKDTLLIILHKNTKLYFHGLMSVTVLHGEVQIFGYTLTPSHENVELYSPRGSSFLFFTTKEGSTLPIRHDLLDILCKLGMENKEATELHKNLLSTSAIIMCKKLIKNKIEFLQKFISQQIFPKCARNMPQCVFQNKIDNWNVLKIPYEWDNLISLLKSSSKVFLCGGKSVGKSTMLRYMINKLLPKYSEVLVIDLDPGQPEFTVPGCISATVVNEPIFGPNYTHLKKPKRCLFVSYIDISYNADSYLTAVKELINSSNFYCKGPTLINYMGFTRGLSLEILAAVVAYAQPNIIIEIRSNSKQRNYQDSLSYELIAEKSKSLTSYMDTLPKFDIHHIHSAADRNEGWHLLPRQIREMCVLSYLGEILPESVLSLTNPNVPVYEVDLSLVKLVQDRTVVPPYIVNANLIALCSLNETYTSYTCHGWAVVRGVDVSTNQLSLLTPLPSEELQGANYLVLGSVALPPSLHMTADDNTGLVPYVSKGVLATLGKIPKRSHIPPKSKKIDCDGL